MYSAYLSWAVWKNVCRKTWFKGLQIKPNSKVLQNKHWRWEMQTSWSDNSAGPVSARESPTKTITVGRLASCREPILREVKDERKKECWKKTNYFSPIYSRLIGAHRVSTKPLSMKAGVRTFFFCAFAELLFPEDANRKCAEVHRDNFLGSVADDRITDWFSIRSMVAARRSYHAFGHVLESRLSATICVYVLEVFGIVGWVGSDCGRYYWIWCYQNVTRKVIVI